MVHRNPKTGKSLGDSGLFVLIEWSPKNKLSPYDYCKSSRESVEWVCSECGWEWSASINNRTAKKNPTGCPACGGKTHKPQNGKSFADLHPDLIKEWSDKNNCSPWEVYPNEAKPERWWVCPICNTEYLMNCNHRSCGQSCNKKECVSYKISKSKSTPIVGLSLGDEHPDLISEWSPDNMLTPFDVKSGSGYVSKIPPKGRSLFDKNHALALEWSDNNKKTPHEIFPSDRTKYLWICPVHGEYSMSCKSRVYLGSGCQTCGVEKVSKAKRTPKKGNSFSEKMPDLVNEWSSKNKEVPINVKWKSNDPYWWVCPNGHEWLATPNKRSSGRGCPVCSHKNNKPAINESLGEVYPDLINEWCSDNSRSIFEVYPGSHYKAIWVCNSCKYKWTTEVYHRSSGKGCPSCSSVILPPKEGTSLADIYPNLINEWSPSNDKTPWEVYPSSNYQAKWVCGKGHEWVSMCYSRTGPNKTGCPNCSHSGTSQIEQNLRLALLPFGASTKPNTKLGKWSVDIYFPDSKTIVEYDGSWAHSHPGSIERDKRKSLYLLTQGYRVIRIREISHSFQLSSLEIRNKNYFEIFYKNGYHKKYSSVPTQDLIEEVRRLFNEA